MQTRFPAARVWPSGQQKSLANKAFWMERKTRFELATLALARRCSTTELLPRVFRSMLRFVRFGDARHFAIPAAFLLLCLLALAVHGFARRSEAPQPRKPQHLAQI